MQTSWDYMVRKMEWGTREDNMISFLQQVGPDGWELVAVVPTSPATPDVHYAYFKRPRIAPRDVADEGAEPRIRRL